MTRERVKGQSTFLCDGPKCNEFFEPDNVDFTEQVAMLREAGWTTDKIGSDWLHYCPGCSRRQPDIEKLLP
jgi:hypothetical protein